ncbi:MAG: DnaJ domain-containing protein, partial [Candidatus Dadabacteria bacterium]|nr:DnaJ domain-containing protein [Candidatus Dadabacteria bacterium]
MPNYQSDAPDYYKTLGVDREAGEDEIRRSWIELMKSNHPDLAGAETAETAKRINEAYGVLGNQEKREAYDRKFLPPVPVIVPTFDLQKNVYIGAPILVVILIALVYAAGSGLIFKSQEEKEQMARVIEHPALPNPVYRGDTLAERTEKLEQAVEIEEEADYDVPPPAETIDKRAPLAASEKNLPEPRPVEADGKIAEAGPGTDNAGNAGEVIA